MIVDIHFNVVLSPLQRQLPFWILWRIWKSRNELIYQQKGYVWYSDLHKAIEEAQEWSPVLHPISENAQVNSGLSSQWTKPVSGFFKCNYDCHYRRDDVSKGAWILRDDVGFFLEAGKSTGQKCSSVIEAELQALLIAMQQAWIKGYRKIVFEGDNKEVISILMENKLNFNVHNWVYDILKWKTRFEEIRFLWTPRQNNQAADRLAKHSSLTGLFTSMFYVSHCITTIFHEDHIAALSL